MTIPAINPAKRAIYLLGEYQVIKDKSYQITFEFSNNTGRPLTVGSVKPGVDMSGFQEGAVTCVPEMEVPHKGTCYLKGVYTPEKQGDSTQALSATMTYQIGEHVKTVEARKLVTVIAGKFIYKKDAIAIGSLKVKPGESNVVVKLANDGKAIISNLVMSLAAPIVPYVDRTHCTGLTLLYPDMSCDLVITIPYNIDSAINGQYAITATGSNVDNSPARFYLDILTRGHLIVTNSQGESKNIHLLKQGSVETLTVKNTGSMDISNFLFEPAADIASYFPEENNTCRNNDGSSYTLNAGASCQIQYQIPAINPVNGTFALNFKGDGADNLPQSVLVLIASDGHLVFSHNNLVTTSTDVIVGESGTISISNQGGKDITDFSVELPADIKNNNYITSNTCIRSDHTLQINDTCEIKYTIPPEADIGIYFLKVRGNNFDNEDPTFIMTILSGRPYYSFDFLSDYIHGNKVESNIAGLSSLSLQNSPIINQVGPKGINNAIGFDGVDQYAQFDDTSRRISGNFTIDFWAMFDSFSQSWSRVFDMGNGSENNNILIAHQRQTANFVLDIYRGQGNDNKTRIIISNYWMLHKWVHATITVTESGVIHIFRNGKYIDLESPPEGITIIENTQPDGPYPDVERRYSYIGKSNWTSDKYFKGKIASVVIYKGIVEPK